MRKLKYILASVVLSAGFASCETEVIDEKVKDDSLPGKSILSFDLNAKETVVTDKVTVGFVGGTMSINANLSLINEEDTSNPETRYKPAHLHIRFSSLVVGNFPTVLSVDNPSNFMSSATLMVQEFDDEGEKVWIEYSTLNAAENQNAGYGNITHVNGTAKYMNGNFEYILFPEEENSLFETQRISKGNFNYITY